MQTQYPQISISELYTLKNKREKIKTNTFNAILDKCHKKIKSIASQGGQCMFFEIPFVLWGDYPLYDMNECMEYVVEALRKNGLLIQILPYPNHNTIYISWKPSDVKIRKQLTSSKYPF
jgi:hypothetical protein